MMWAVGKVLNRNIISVYGKSLSSSYPWPEWDGTGDEPDLTGMPDPSALAECVHIFNEWGMPPEHAFDCCNVDWDIHHR